MSYDHDTFFPLWRSWEHYQEEPGEYVELQPTTCTVRAQRYGGITDMSMTIPARWRKYGAIQRGAIIRVGSSSGSNRFGIFIVTGRSSQHGSVTVSGTAYPIYRLRHRYPEMEIKSDKNGDYSDLILGLTRACYFPSVAPRNYSIDGHTVNSRQLVLPMTPELYDAPSDEYGGRKAQATKDALGQENTESYRADGSKSAEQVLRDLCMMTDSHYYYDGVNDTVIVAKLARVDAPHITDGNGVYTIDARECTGAGDSIEYGYGDLVNTIHVVGDAEPFAPVRRTPWTFSNRFAMKRQGGMYKASYNARGISSEANAKKIAATILKDYAWGSSRYTITQHEKDGVIIPGTRVVFIGDHDGRLCESKPLDIQSIEYTFDGKMSRKITLGAPKIQEAGQRIAQGEEISYPATSMSMRFASEAQTVSDAGGDGGTVEENVPDDTRDPWRDIEDDEGSEPEDVYSWKSESDWWNTDIPGSGGVSGLLTISEVSFDSLKCRTANNEIVTVKIPPVLQRIGGSVAYPDGQTAQYTAGNTQYRDAVDADTGIEESQRITPMYYVGESILAIKPVGSNDWYECGGCRSWAVI